MKHAHDIKEILIIFTALSILLYTGCNHSTGEPGHDIKSKDMKSDQKNESCTDQCKPENSNGLSCKLTSAEMHERKATVVESLRRQTLEKKELENGFAFKFAGSDSMLDELTEFIKTERACCDFFTFNISVAGNQQEIWFDLTGPRGAKEFIKTELEW